VEKKKKKPTAAGEAIDNEREPDPITATCSSDERLSFCFVLARRGRLKRKRKEKANT